MANGKLKIVASIYTPPVQPEACNSAKVGCAIAPDEGLRLMRAFVKISDPKRRAALIEQVESLAAS